MSLKAPIYNSLVLTQLPEVSAQAIPSDTWFNSYHAYADHITFFNDLQAAFPTYSEILNIGPSVQGRQLFGIHIWGSGGKGSKPAIYFHGTVHAREWISSKVVEYLAYNFLTQYNDTAVKAIHAKVASCIMHPGTTCDRWSRSSWLIIHLGGSTETETWGFSVFGM